MLACCSAYVASWPGPSDIAAQANVGVQVNSGPAEEGQNLEFLTHFGPEQPRFAVMHKRATLFPLDDDLGYRHSRDDFAYVSLAGGVIHQQAHPGIDNTLVIRT